MSNFLCEIPMDVASSDYLSQQPLRLFLQGEDVCTDFLKGAQGLRLIEIAGEAYLVADPDASRVEPCIRGNRGAPLWL